MSHVCSVISHLQMLLSKHGSVHVHVVVNSSEHDLISEDKFKVELLICGSTLYFFFNINRFSSGQAGESISNQMFQQLDPHKDTGTRKPTTHTSLSCIGSYVFNMTSNNSIVLVWLQK